MLAKIQKWGNSLALRIPKGVAKQAGLACDSLVEIKLVDGQIHIVPLQETHYELASLLAKLNTLLR